MKVEATKIGIIETEKTGSITEVAAVTFVKKGHKEKIMKALHSEGYAVGGSTDSPNLIKVFMVDEDV